MSDMKMKITKTIKELGIPANVSGYHYMRYAIELMINDLTLINAITKKLYPAVAKQFNSTASRVERAIRHAIEVGWERGDLELVEKMFGYSVSADKCRPTNGEFIATVADYLLLESGENK